MMGFESINKNGHMDEAEIRDFKTSMKYVFVSSGHRSKRECHPFWNMYKRYVGIRLRLKVFLFRK